MLPNAVENDLLSYLKALLKDDQDFVRLYIIEALVAFAKAYTNNTQVELFHALIANILSFFGIEIEYSCNSCS